MAEDLILKATGREQRYAELFPQVKALVEDETDLTANLANICAAVREAFGFLWVGFYIVKHGQLVLGPFQGPVACTRIDKGQGVCGVSWTRRATVIVDDVDRFPGHIACSSHSKSEIVIPVIVDDEVVAVLDVDHTETGAFSLVDEFYLKKIIELIDFRNGW